MARKKKGKKMSIEAPKLWIYIAGPYSKPDPVSNTTIACGRYVSLRRNIPEGLIICPHWSMVQALIRPMPHEYWMKHDFALIRALALSGIPGCISRMPGESAGADMETKLAKELDLSVFTDLGSVYLWANSILKGQA